MLETLWSTSGHTGQGELPTRNTDISWLKSGNTSSMPLPILSRLPVVSPTQYNNMSLLQKIAKHKQWNYHLWHQKLLQQNWKWSNEWKQRKQWKQPCTWATIWLLWRTFWHWQQLWTDCWTETETTVSITRWWLLERMNYFKETMESFYNKRIERCISF